MAKAVKPGPVAMSSAKWYRPMAANSVMMPKLSLVAWGTLTA